MFHRETVEKNRSYFIANMGVAAILTFTLVQVDDGNLLGRKSTQYFVNESVFLRHNGGRKITPYGTTAYDVRPNGASVSRNTLIHKINLEVESS